MFLLKFCQITFFCYHSFVYFISYYLAIAIQHFCLFYQADQFSEKKLVQTFFSTTFKNSAVSSFLLIYKICQWCSCFWHNLSNLSYLYFLSYDVLPFYSAFWNFGKQSFLPPSIFFQVNSAIVFDHVEFLPKKKVSCFRLNLKILKECVFSASVEILPDNIFCYLDFHRLMLSAILVFWLLTFCDRVAYSAFRFFWERVASSAFRKSAK